LVPILYEGSTHYIRDTQKKSPTLHSDDEFVSFFSHFALPIVLPQPDIVNGQLRNFVVSSIEIPEKSDGCLVSDVRSVGKDLKHFMEVPDLSHVVRTLPLGLVVCYFDHVQHLPLFLRDWLSVPLAVKPPVKMPYARQVAVPGKTIHFCPGRPPSPFSLCLKMRLPALGHRPRTGWCWGQGIGRMGLVPSGSCADPARNCRGPSNTHRTRL
jgi:hypothetical protein